MSSMHPVQRTSELWNLSPTLPAMLHAPSEHNQAGPEEQSESNARCNSQDQRFSQQGRDCLGIEITETSFYKRGFE